MREVGYGFMLVCCLILLGLSGTRWQEILETPGVLICAAIAAYLVIGTAALFITDAQWRLATGKDILRQIFFLLVLLAALLGGRMILARTGAESLLKGVLAILLASCLVVLATPLLRYWDILLTFRLPFRLSGAFTDPNDAGFIGCMTVVLVLALLAHSRQGRFGYFGLAVGCVAAMVSFSRTALLVVCGILVFLPLCNGGRKWNLFFLGSVAMGLVGSAWYATVASGLWPLRDLTLGRDLNRFEFCLPLPQTSPGLLADCEILLGARDTLAGDAPLNWSRVVPIDVWQGVRVDGPQGRVTELSLPGMGLNGRIPPQLGDLDQLATLRLTNNHLTGTLPPELANLKNLKNLWLANNYLTGTLPPALEKFAPLVDATVVAKQPYIPLREPTEVDVAAGAERLRIPLPASANIEVVSAENLFCQVGQVNTGLLADCNVLLAARDALAGDQPLNWSEDIPIGFWQGVIVGNVPPVRVVGLGLPGMGLNGRIPPQLGDLDQLTLLLLATNRLTGPIPPELGKLANLQVLSLGANVLSGTIPPELDKLEKLTDLWLAENRLTGSVPPKLEAFGGQAFGLITGDPHRSSLTGVEFVKSDFARGTFCQVGQVNTGLLADCNVLLAARDALAGDQSLNWSEDIPIGSWQGVIVGSPSERVVALNLPGMDLNGRIPPQLGDLDQLVLLRLANNWLTGPIPPELGKLANLQVLSLTTNALSGTIPPELGKLEKLQGLWLADNDLTGPSPLALFGIAGQDLTNETLCLDSHTTISSGLLADCEILLTARDIIAGDQPLNWSVYVPIGFWQGVTVGGTGQVVRLDLAEQGLNGRIPPEFGGLDQLVTLRLSRNQLTGTVPPELDRLVNLNTLALESNLLTDPFPPELIREDLALRLTGNNFSLQTAVLTSRRFSIWKEYLEEGLESPFVGSGLATAQSLAGNLKNAQGSPEGIHNLYLMLLGEAGIAPLVLYCLFLFFLLRLRWTAPRSLARDVAVGWAVIMALFGVNYHDLLTFGAFMFLAGLSCALGSEGAGGEPSAQRLSLAPRKPGR